MTSNTDLDNLMWHKSSYSNGSGGDCVEVAVPAAAGLLVRDSTRPAGPIVAVGPVAWGAFVAGVQGRSGS
jgi:hypothetical protein